MNHVWHPVSDRGRQLEAGYIVYILGVGPCTVVDLGGGITKFRVNLPNGQGPVVVSVLDIIAREEWEYQRRQVQEAQGRQASVHLQNRVALALPYAIAAAALVAVIDVFGLWSNVGAFVGF